MSGEMRRGTRVRAGTIRFTFDGREYLGQPGDTAASALLAQGVRSMRPQRQISPSARPADRGPRGAERAAHGRPPPGRHSERSGAAARASRRAGAAQPESLADAALGILPRCCRPAAACSAPAFTTRPSSGRPWRTYEPIIRRLAGLGEAPGGMRAAAGCGRASVAATCWSPARAPRGSPPRARQRAPARASCCASASRCAAASSSSRTARIDGQPALEWVASTLAELAGARRAGADATRRWSAASGGEMIAHAEPGGLPGANTHVPHPAARLRHRDGRRRAPDRIRRQRPAGRHAARCRGALPRALRRARRRASPCCSPTTTACTRPRCAWRPAACGVRAIVDTRGEAHAGDRRGGVARPTRSAAEPSASRATPSRRPRAARGYAPRAWRRSAGRARRGASPATPPAERRLVAGVHAGLQEGGTRAVLGRARRLHRRRSAAVASIAQVRRTAISSSAPCSPTATRPASGRRRRAGVRCSPASSVPGRGDVRPRLAPFWRSPAPRAAEKRQFVDLQNDVTVADLRQALAEGFADIEHVKRYTTLGFGTDQGATSGVLGAAILAELKGEGLAAVGTSRPRPPFQPVTSALARGSAHRRAPFASRGARRCMTGTRPTAACSSRGLVDAAALLPLQRRRRVCGGHRGGAPRAPNPAASSTARRLARSKSPDPMRPLSSTRCI